jgi:hypothetical protein
MINSYIIINARKDNFEFQNNNNSENSLYDKLLALVLKKRNL